MISEQIQKPKPVLIGLKLVLLYFLILSEGLFQRAWFKRRPVVSLSSANSRSHALLVLRSPSLQHLEGGSSDLAQMFTWTQRRTDLFLVAEGHRSR